MRTKAPGASIARVRTCTCMHTVHVRVCTVHAHFTRTCTADRQIDDALYFLYVRYELLSNILIFSALFKEQNVLENERMTICIEGNRMQQDLNT